VSAALCKGWKGGEHWVAIGFMSPLLPHSPHSLYKEDEPNVFAEPAALAQQLLPFLVQLLEKAPSSALHWLQAAGPSVLQDLHYCQQRWSHGMVAALGWETYGPKEPAAHSTFTCSPCRISHALLDEGTGLCWAACCPGRAAGEGTAGCPRTPTAG